ncbi:DUF2946 domain-containing protein [Paraburkholderia silviterrae]|uniref:DUF2946 domain-containing protein n=1 Tax=Paraburkholderia silviterrae TaxID=2528715 RepID=A0A4R5M6L0_9BURK|nr:DUF2946 domain-containing protein [Paraburkholderia silviterrae]TDG21016.1 DUF2946 domain-containing protein [Paraburkholderia silviterrae]
MFRVRLQKLGSLLGLLAILMATLAPAVSQVLASHQQLSNALATYCTVESAADPAGHDGTPAHSAAPHWQACAYCGLLAHVPALTGGAVALAVTLLVVRVSAPEAWAEVRAAFAHTAAQPRAPPVFS